MMSGKNSRYNRKFAVRLANKAVYAYNGADYSDAINPFNQNTHERQQRIFKKYYIMNQSKYHWLNGEMEEMFKAYGHSPPPPRDNLSEYMEMLKEIEC